MTEKRTAIVTGGGKRIGAHLLEVLLDRGWTVVAHVRREEDEVAPLRVVGGEGFRTTTTSNFRTIVVDCSFSRALAMARI